MRSCGDEPPGRCERVLLRATWAGVQVGAVTAVSSRRRTQRTRQQRAREATATAAAVKIDVDSDGIVTWNKFSSFVLNLHAKVVRINTHTRNSNKHS